MIRWEQSLNAAEAHLPGSLAKINLPIQYSEFIEATISPQLCPPLI